MRYKKCGGGGGSCVCGGGGSCVCGGGGGGGGDVGGTGGDGDGGGGQKLLPLPKYPDRLWGPRRLFFNKYCGSFLGGKGTRALSELTFT